MAIKYNPYNWEIRPRRKNYDPQVTFNVDIDEEKIIKAIMESIEISFKDDSE